MPAIHDITIYRPTRKTLNELFNFSVKYFLDPQKRLEGRTSGEPRGLGSIIDSFMHGKLMEYALKSLIEKCNPSFRIGIDISTEGRTQQNHSDPDIIEVKENGIKRVPYIHIEVKATSDNHRWITLPAVQLTTPRGSTRSFCSCYLSIKNDHRNSNNRTGDVFGVFLKKRFWLTSTLWKFQRLKDIYCQLEFVLEESDFKTHCFHAKTKDNVPLYDVSILNNTQLFTKKGILYKNWTLEKTITGKRSIRLFEVSGVEISNDFGFLKWAKGGKIDIYKKEILNKGGTKISSVSKILVPSKDIILTNKYLGTFQLVKNQPYNANMYVLVERQKEEYIISKRRILELIQDGSINSPEIALKQISTTI